MTALYSNIRKQVKSNNKKLISITYTPEIYTIEKVSNKPTTSTVNILKKPYYTVKDSDGDIITLDGKKIRFYSSDLVNAEGSNPSALTNAKAMKLNNVAFVSDEG